MLVLDYQHCCQLLATITTDTSNDIVEMRDNCEPTVVHVLQDETKVTNNVVGEYGIYLLAKNFETFIRELI